MKKLKSNMIILIVIMTIITTGCNISAINTANPKDNIEENEDENQEKENDLEDNDKSEDKEDEKNDNEKEEEKQVKEIDLQKVKPNEAGQVMVLMYHSIGEPEGQFRRTPDNFRKDLKILYEKGYRPISLEDYVKGNITTEAGYTPIVLTFDDGWQDNFNLIETENNKTKIDPDCAVAILEEFNKKHPDFPLEATFFVNMYPFGQQKYIKEKLKYIVDKGMDIGNHTINHANFSKANITKIQKELSGIVKMVNNNIDYNVNTLSLPFGERPDNKDLYKYLESGEYEGTEYKNIAILNVGWDPDKSPYHNKFNRHSIHRIRASDLEKYVQGVGMYDWMKHFETGARTKYISDGNSDIVTVPKGFEDVIDDDKIKNKNLRVYTIKK